ncbi:MAG: cysteine desulfurase family protein [Candidatus Paceibacterota bacterium]|jgi:cysteine desulfurase
MKIYLDNSATTPVDKRVISLMKKYWRDDFANPSSIHSLGVKAKNILEESRKVIADFINGHDREIIFTSGGTEANNLAIFGVANKILKLGKKVHLITTEIEHSSVSECFDKLEKDGAEITYLKVDENGLINPKDLRDNLKEETLLVSIGYANSEIGVIQPIKEIIKEIRHKRKEFDRGKFGFPYLHLDASQAGQYLNMNVEELGVDLMTLDAQKMYGPKGIGVLFVRDSIEIEPIVFGGGQEKGRRSGTENIPLIVGFAEAVKIVQKLKEKEIQRLTKLRDYFFDEIKKIIPKVIINGHLNERLPNNINISILGQDGEMMVFRLDERGIICSSSSACASGSGESYVVKKIAHEKAAALVASEKTNVSQEEVNSRAKSTLRFSLGRDTKKRHLRKLLKDLFEINLISKL